MGRLLNAASAAALLCALALAACGGDEADQTEPAPSKLPPEGELVVYSRSGGLAFSSDQLAIDTEGHAVLTSEDGEGERRREFDLTADELSDLEAALAAAAGLESPAPSGPCADCYSYSVEADGISISLDDASFGLTSIPPPVTALVQRLGDLVSREGAQPSAELPEADLVVYSRTGGLADLEDHLTIDADGHATVITEDAQGARSTEFDLTAKQLDDLESTLAAAAGVEPSPPATSCDDCYSHSVEAEGVSFTLLDDGSAIADSPAPVKRLIEMIQPLIAKNYRTG